MTDKKGNLSLSGALLLREEYDRLINFYKRILNEEKDHYDNEVYLPADDFDRGAADEKLKKLQLKRLKLNYAVQAANFTTRIIYEEEDISLAEALELRKSLIERMESAFARSRQSVYNTVKYKEERDIVLKPEYSFTSVFAEYSSTVQRLRVLENIIRETNSAVLTAFKDE